jgi:hypothetical protein
MRIQLIALALLLSGQVMAAAVQEKEMKELFTKYYQVMEQHKVELIDEVFSKKFITENGGKDTFAKDVKELPKISEKNLKATDVTFTKGVMDEIYFAKIKPPVSQSKGKISDGHTPEFIVVVEDGKLKIQGTLSDGD